MRSTLFVLRWARGLPTKLLPEERRALDTVIAELEVMVPARRFEGPLTSFEFVEHSLFMMKGDPPFNAARDTTVRILEMIMDAAEAPKDSKGGMVTTGWSMRDMETTLHVLAVLRTSYTGEELPADSPFGSERVTPKPHPELAKWIAAVDHVIAAVEGWKTHSIRLPKGGTA